jgi:hypothetical protein
MAKVITLDGLEPKSINSDCDEVIEVTSTVLKKTYRVCRQDLERLERRGQSIQIPGTDVIVEPSRLLPASSSARVVGRKGRPRGTTVKAGARKPRVAPCHETKTVLTRTGRSICKCADAGNAQILPKKRCRKDKE